jgi:hypothetical protein
MSHIVLVRILHSIKSWVANYVFFPFLLLFYGKPLQYLNFEEYIRRGNVNDMPIQVIINQNRSGFEHDAEEVDRTFSTIYTSYNR